MEDNAMKPFDKRPQITTGYNNIILHDGKDCRVVMTRKTISVGCTDISIEAARELMRIYDEKFPSVPESFVVQP